MEPGVPMNTILLVQPRQVQFKWVFDKAAGSVGNIGNPKFKLLINKVQHHGRGGRRLVSASWGYHLPPVVPSLL